MTSHLGFVVAGDRRLRVSEKLTWSACLLDSISVLEVPDGAPPLYLQNRCSDDVPQLELHSFCMQNGKAHSPPPPLLPSASYSPLRPPTTMRSSLPIAALASAATLYDTYNFNPLEHLAGISPYFEPGDPPRDPTPPEGCSVTRAAYLVRHAAINA